MCVHVTEGMLVAFEEMIKVHIFVRYIYLCRVWVRGNQHFLVEQFDWLQCDWQYVGATHAGTCALAVVFLFGGGGLTRGAWGAVRVYQSLLAVKQLHGLAGMSLW